MLNKNQHYYYFNGQQVAKGIDTTLTDLQTLLDGLQDSAKSLDAIDAQVKKMPALLDTLLSRDGSSGSLAVLSAGLQTIQTDVNAGKLNDARTTVATLRQQLAKMFTGSVDPAACPDPAAKPDKYPPGTIDSVIWLSIYASCRATALSGTLDAWFQQASGTYSAADKSLADAIALSEKALKDSVDQIDQASDALAGQLDAARAAVDANNQAAIDQAQKSNQEALDAITASFTQSSDAVVTSLTDQVGAAVTDADAAKARLQEDFNMVLASLGSTDTTDRDGLLGTVRGVVSTTGDTVTILDTVTQTTTAQSGALSSQLLALQMAAAQYKAAQARSGDLDGFPGAPNGVKAAVVFSYHISGK